MGSFTNTFRANKSGGFRGNGASDSLWRTATAIPDNGGAWVLGTIVIGGRQLSIYARDRHDPFTRAAKTLANKLINPSVDEWDTFKAALETDD